MCVALVVAWWMCGFVGKSSAGHEKPKVLSARRLSATRPCRGSYGSEGRPSTSWTSIWQCCRCAPKGRGLIGSRNMDGKSFTCGVLRRRGPVRDVPYADASRAHPNAYKPVHTHRKGIPLDLATSRVSSAYVVGVSRGGTCPGIPSSTRRVNTVRHRAHSRV